MAREIELKFDLPLGCGPTIAAAMGGVEPDRKDQAAVYFDTEDGHVRKAGYSLRIRRSGPRFFQTIKFKADSSAGLFDRHEWEAPVAGFDLDFGQVDRAPVGDLLTPKLRGKLVPLIWTKVTRSLWRLDRDGSEIELTLDEGEIRSKDSIAPVAEMELELRRGDPSTLFHFAAELGELAPLRLGVLSKAERGYALAQNRLGKAAKSEKVRLDPAMTTAQGFAATAYSCLRHFRLNESVLLEAQDAAALHQMRVATRRLRSAFSLFRSVTTDSTFDRLREELRWFTGQLGSARNIDVLSERVIEVDGIEEGEAFIRDRLGDARQAAYAEVMEALHSQRLRQLLLDLICWIEIGEWRSRPKAAKPLTAFASRQLGKRWRKVKNEGALLRELDEESRHRLRIDIKKLRYSAEFLASLHPDEAATRGRKQFLEGLESLQEELGLLNDEATGRDLISNLALDAAAEEQALEALLGTRTDEERKLSKSERAYRQAADAAGYWA